MTKRLTPEAKWIIIALIVLLLIGLSYLVFYTDSLVGSW